MELIIAFIIAMVLLWLAAEPETESAGGPAALPVRRGHVQAGQVKKPCQCFNFALFLQ